MDMPGFSPEYYADRNKMLISYRRTGKTLQACADKFGITHERVRQIEARTRRLERKKYLYPALRYIQETVQIMRDLCLSLKVGQKNHDCSQKKRQRS